MVQQVQAETEKVTVEREASETVVEFSERRQGQLERREFLKYVAAVLASLGLGGLIPSEQLGLKAKGQPAPPQVPGLRVRTRPAANPHILIGAAAASAELGRVLKALANQGFSTKILDAEAHEFEVDHLERKIERAATGTIVIFKLAEALLLHLKFERIYVAKPGITPTSGTVAMGAVVKVEEAMVFEDRPDQGLRINHWNTTLAKRLMEILLASSAYQLRKERLLRDGLRPAEEFHVVRVNPEKMDKALIVIPVMKEQVLVTSGLVGLAARVDLTTNTVLEVWEEWR